MGRPQILKIEEIEREKIMLLMKQRYDLDRDIEALSTQVRELRKLKYNKSLQRNIILKQQDEIMLKYFSK